MCKCSTACDCAESVTTISTGTDGLDGNNAYTLLTSYFTQPIIGGLVTIQVSTNNQNIGSWGAIGQYIYIENGGYYIVSSSTATTMIIQNTGVSGNAAPGTTIATNSKVSPAGSPGIQGINGNDGKYILYNYSNNTGIGTTADLIETILASYILPANTLSVDYDEIEVDAYVLYINPDSILMRFKIAGVTLFSEPYFNDSASTIRLNFKLVRLGSSSQFFISQGLAQASTIPGIINQDSPATIDLTINNLIEFTGTNLDTGVANQLTLKKFTVYKNSQ